jgi:MFS family permease
MTAMGIGSVVGALVAGARGRVSDRLLILSSAVFGVLILAVAVAPTIELAALALVPLGAASVTFAAGVNSALQLAVSPEMRGRVMALYSMVFLGSTPIGGPLSGWLAETWSPRVALLVGAAAALTAAAGARIAFARVDASARESRADSPHASCDSGRSRKDRAPARPALARARR